MARSPKVHHSTTEPVHQNIFPGAEIEFIHSPNMTFASWSFSAGTEVPSHSHPHEQITHCIAGALILKISDDEVVLGPGETAVIASGAEHSACADVPTSGVDVFFPVREDYKLGSVK